MSSERELRAASFNDRLFAAVIDTAIVSIVSVGAAAINDFEIDEWPVVLFQGVLAALYDIILTAGWGRTPGKAVIGMYVTTSPDKIRYMGLGKSTWRYVVKAFEPMATVVAMVGVAADAFEVALGLYTIIILMTIYMNPLKRGLHDRAAGSYVMKAVPVED